MPTVKPVFKLETQRKLYLASASPRRKELLESLALPFTIVRADNSEPDPHPNEDPFSFVARAAKAKGLGALKGLNPAAESFILIAADTIVCLDREILGKPDDAIHAFHMLQKLAGRSHQVLSSAYICWNRAEALAESTFTEATEVVFYNWPDQILKTYSQSREPLDKAGAYAIQGLGSFLAKSIDGSWTNVVGLPMSTLIKKMLELGLLVPNT